MSLKIGYIASVIYQNLSDLIVKPGRSGQEPAGSWPGPGSGSEGRDNGFYESNPLALQAWAYHLQGDLNKASQHFREVEALEKEINSSIRYLYSLIEAFGMLTT